MEHAAYIASGALWNQVHTATDTSATMRDELGVLMPTEVNEILNSRCGLAVRDVLDYIWTDLQVFVKNRLQDKPISVEEQVGVAVIWKHLPSLNQTLMENLMKKRLTEDNEKNISAIEFATV